MSIRDWLAPSGRAEQAGMFLAGASVPLTLQRTLMPRGVSDQALATGIVMALEYAVGALVQDTVEAAAMRAANSHEHSDELEDKTWRRYTLVLDIAAMALGTALKNAFRQKEAENVARSWARLAGNLIANGAFAGFSVAAFQEVSDDLHLRRVRSFPLALPAAVVLAGLIDSLRKSEESPGCPGELTVAQEWEAFGLSPFIALGLAGLSVGERAFAHTVSHLLSRYFEGHERLWRPLGHVAAILGIGYLLGMLIKLVYGRIEEIASGIEPAFDKPPKSELVSGGPGSLVPWETLSKQGRRYISTYLREEWIERVMGQPALVEPIRVFAAFDCAESDEERVDLAMRELERTGAFERSLLMVISPTGTGYVNYVAVEAAEYMTLGDMASIALQYSKRPSVLSMDRVPEGVRQYRMFIEALHSRLEQLPQEKRPRVVLFGESLGAWTSEDAFADTGTKGMQSHGVDRGLWIGTPHATKWKSQVLHSPRSDVDESQVGAFNDFGQVESLPPEKRSRLRYVMITHYNDAVAQFGLDLLAREPEWLGDPDRRPPTVPTTEVYSPLITFVLTLIDMKNSANVIPGKFDAKGHDYRKDLAPFVREVYGLRCSDERLDHVEKALREYESARQVWIDSLDKPEKKKAEKKADHAGGHGDHKKKPHEKKPAARGKGSKKAAEAPVDDGGATEGDVEAEN